MLFLGLAGAAGVSAQEFPARPLKLIVPYAAGGSVDLLGRAFAEKMQAVLGQPIVAENRTGATGVIAHQAIARAAPDGYTLGVSGTSPLVLAPHQYRNLGYDPAKDFAYIACPGATPFVLDVHAALPVKSVAELVAYAKANPGRLNYGSAGVGNSAHLAAALFQHVAGVDLTHVPYKGNALAMTDLNAGQIQVLFDPVQTTLPQLKNGRIRALAVTSRTRFAGLPDVPTIAESGFPSYEFTVWYAFIAPAGTPPAVVARLNAEVNRVVRDGPTRERFAAMGADLAESTPDGCAAMVQKALPFWGKMFADLGIRPE
ncbi:MAG: tripartite tricarboxylate transporter substrate binding protein [Burkholderiales bacterium]|nr:tripartite tricarboxylate transporter substrate binding protein [Burkholderiales bacterium]